MNKMYLIVVAVAMLCDFIAQFLRVLSIIELKVKPFLRLTALWSWWLSLVFIVLSGQKSLIPPGWDINPSQVSSQQLLVLCFYL